MVAQMGLLEDEANRYDKETTMLDADEQIGRGGTIAASARHQLRGGMDARQRAEQRFRDFFGGLQRACGVPERVALVAVSMLQDYVGALQAKGRDFQHQNETAAACFLLSAARSHVPVQAAEIKACNIAGTEHCTPMKIAEAMKQVIDTLGLAAERQELAKCLHEDLARLYLGRLALPMSHSMPALVATMAKQMPVHLPNRSDSMMIAAAIFVLRMSRLAAKEFGIDRSTGTADQLQVELLSATREDRASLYSILQDASKKSKELVRATREACDRDGILQMRPQQAVAAIDGPNSTQAATEPSRKRPRDDDTRE